MSPREECVETPNEVPRIMEAERGGHRLHVIKFLKANCLYLLFRGSGGVSGANGVCAHVILVLLANRLSSLT